MPCSICKKTGHNKKTCTFQINNIERIDLNENLIECKNVLNYEDKIVDVVKEIYLNNNDNIDNILENEEIFENIQPQLLVQKDHKYNLCDLNNNYIKITFNIMPKFGDIIQFCKDKAYDCYIIGYNNEFIYAPQYDDTGAGNLVIPYEITKYTKNAVELYKNIHPNLTKIYVRYDDLFISKIMGLIDKSWSGKIAWLSFSNSIEVNFNNTNDNNDDDENNNDVNKIIMIEIDENLTYQKIELLKQNMNKKQIMYNCKIDFYENEECDDSDFIHLIKPPLYKTFSYDTYFNLNIQDVFSYEYNIIGPEEDKILFEKTIYDFYENEDNKKYIEKINLSVI